MSLLLDTNVFLWWVNQSRLSAAAREAIGEPLESVFVSAVVIWEIAIKRNLGRLDAPADIERHISLNNFRPLFINLAHASAAGSLPRHHDDPFDRMLVAQAQVEGLTLVTRDRALAPYGVPTIRA